MIIIYEKTTSNFNNNGLAVLEPESCTFSPVINNVWHADITLPLDAEQKYLFIENERILKITGIDCIREQTSDYQLFKIINHKKDLHHVYVEAWPIGLDARLDTYTNRIQIFDKTATEALAMINAMSNKYTVSGSGYDATKHSTEYEKTNMIAVLNGADSSVQNTSGESNYQNFVKTWDGEICYDNYNIKVNHRLGDDTDPYDVRYGKNITGMSYTLDNTNIITRLYAYAKSGEALNAISDYAIDQYPYVDAENFSEYPIPHIYYAETPYNLVQLSNDGSKEYEKSHELYEAIKWATAGWLHEALLNDNVYGGLLKEIELDWIRDNYALTQVNDGVQGIVDYMARKIWYNSSSNIRSGTVQSLIYNAMKAGFDEVLKNTESTWYIGTSEKDWLSDSGGSFYTYDWDSAGNYRLEAPSGEYAWAYTASKWRQVNDQGYATGTTDSAKWKWYKKKPNNFKFYGNKKKSRKLHDQWWKINDVWYYFESNGKGRKDQWLNTTYYEYFDEAEINYGSGSRTLYEILLPVCIEGEEELFQLLYRQMTAYCMGLFEYDKLSYPTVKLEINMVDLSKTTEYANYTFLEKIHLGDTVKIFNPIISSQPSTARIIGLKYDVLKGFNTEIQIGVTETSVINLLNSIGSSTNEPKYVFGDSFEIVNNKIEVKAPATPYLEDVIVNGASVVRNHKAYLDLDEMGIDESIDVLYGEEAPDAETDGEDKDFYFELSEGSGHVINENDYEAYTDATHPISITSFTRVSDTEYNFNITGTPSNDGNGENIFINLTGLIEEEQYTITFDAQYSSGTTFPYYPEYDTIADIRSGTGTSLASEVLQSDTQKHSHTITFTASAVNKLHFFLSSKDNVSTTLSITDLIIDGDIQFVGEIEEFYNKHQSKWLKYNRVKEVKVDGTSVVTDDIANINTMTGSTSSTDGTKGLVPQPTIADREKYLRGDGTWQDAQGASAVSDLTDVELTNLADKEILEYDAVAEKWKNVANSGGGGTSAGVSKIETLRGRTYTEKRQSNVTPFSLLGNILTSTASSQTNSVSNIQSVQKIDVTSIDYFIITVFSLKGIANPYYPYIWLDDSDHSNDDYPTVSSKMQFTSIVNNYTVYVWDVSALTGEKYFGICTGVHTEFKLSVEQSGTPQVVNQPIIYSEEERIVGVWVDNKPLYKQTFHVSVNDSANGSQTITISSYISNIDLINDSEAFIVVNGQTTILPYILSNSGLMPYTIGYALGGDEIYITRGNGGTIQGTAYITLYYTKTTDVAGSGSYNTLGVPTQHISTDEECIGTYMGEPMYQKLITLSSNVTLNTTAKIMDSYADFTMIKQPINFTAIYDVSPEQQTVPIFTFKYNNHVYMQAQTTVLANKILATYTKN